MLVIASQTGWTEDYIRWHLPLSRGFAYFHGARLLEGEDCRWPGGDIEVKNWISNVRANLSKPPSRTSPLAEN